MNALTVALLGLVAQDEPRFVAETIDDGVEIGYGVALGDVDGDGRTDVLLADKRHFAWYRGTNRGFRRRSILAKDLTERDNVCIAARDIDGDGRVEVAVGGEWNPGDTVDSGSVHYLLAPPDANEPWTAIELAHEPVVHRMRWVRVGARRYELVVAPLHGRGNVNGEGAGARLLAYSPPAVRREAWPTTLVDDTLHMTHNFDVCQWDPSTAAEEMLYIGREGALLLSRSGGRWSRTALAGVAGGGEIRLGRFADGSRFVVTIEPMHGSHLVLYRYAVDAVDADGQIAFAERIVLDSTFAGGHAIATGDLCGDDADEIVAGWRQPNADGKTGLRLYRLTATGEWVSTAVDEEDMATEDLRLGDLDDDGRLDIVAAGRATKNLKVYWNRE